MLANEKSRTWSYKGIDFYLGGYTPRNNEFEKGAKYKLFVGPDKIPTDFICSSVAEAKEYVKREWVRFAW